MAFKIINKRKREKTVKMVSLFFDYSVDLISENVFGVRGSVW